MTNCKCNSKKISRQIFCPQCGRFKLNTFLGEPFPKGYLSPFRKTLKGLYSYYSPPERSPIFQRTDGEFCDLKGNEKWPMIANAIKNADICFFDTTGEIFNVGFELGYALTQWDYTSFKKHIIVCSSNKPTGQVLEFMDIFRILPHKKIYSDIIEKYFRFEVFKNCNKKNLNKIPKFTNNTAEKLFDSDIHNYIIKTYGSFKYPTKNYNKDKIDVLIISPKKYNKYLSQINFDGLNNCRVVNLDDFNIFENLDSIESLLNDVAKKIIKKYDYIIIHLLGNRKISSYSYDRKYNFKCGIVGGMMRGFKKIDKRNNIT